MKRPYQATIIMLQALMIIHLVYAMDAPTTTQKHTPHSTTILDLPKDVLDIIAATCLHDACHIPQSITAQSVTNNLKRTVRNFMLTCKLFAKVIAPKLDEPFMAMFVKHLAHRFDTPLSGPVTCLNNPVAWNWYKQVGSQIDLASIPEATRADIATKIKNDHGKQELVHCVQFHHYERLKHIIAAGVDVNILFCKQHTTALINTSGNCVSHFGDNTEIAELLINCGANVHAKSCVNWDQEGKTALIHAAKSGYPLIVELLLDAGADHRCSCNEGKTALSWAQWVKSNEAISKEKKSCYDKIIVRLKLHELDDQMRQLQKTLNKELTSSEIKATTSTLVTLVAELHALREEVKKESFTSDHKLTCIATLGEMIERILRRKNSL